MHGLQFSDKVKQLPRLTPIWAHGAVLAGVRLSESGNLTVLAPGVKCGECLKCVECKWKESGAAGGGSARRELVAIRLIGGGVVIDPGISPLPPLLIIHQSRMLRLFAQAAAAAAVILSCVTDARSPLPRDFPTLVSRRHDPHVRWQALDQTTNAGWRPLSHSSSPLSIRQSTDRVAMD